MFLGGICTGPFGFATQTTCDLLNHLYQTYGQVKSLDLKENDIAMQKLYNFASSIECLYEQIDNGQIFATNAYTPYTLKKIVNMGEAEIVARGIYNLDYCE